MADALQVVQRRSHILVYGFDVGDKSGMDDLKAKLTVWEENPFGGHYASFRGYLFDVDPKGRKVLLLPGSVPEEMLKKAFPFHDFVVAMEPWAYRSVEVPFRSLEYPYRDKKQEDITDFLTRTGKYRGKPEWGSDLVVAGTAVGKTYSFLRAWSFWGNPLYATFAASNHLENFLRDLKRFTEVPEDRILVVDGNESLRKAMREPERWTATLGLQRTISNSINSVIEPEKSSVTSRDGVPFLDFLRKVGVGTLLADEAHLELQALIQMSLMTNVLRTVYLTATPDRTKWSEARLLKMQLPLGRAHFTKKEARLEYVQVSYSTSPDEKQERKSRNRRGYFDLSWYSDYLGSPEKYEAWLRMIEGFCRRELDAGSTGVGIVLGGKLELLGKLHRDLKKAFPERSVGNFTSMIKDQVARQDELAKDIIVTTDKSFGGSVNPPNMDTMLLLAPVTSKPWLEQMAGRLRGLDGRNCRLFDLAGDLGFESLREQAKIRSKVLAQLAKSTSTEEHTFA